MRKSILVVIGLALICFGCSKDDTSDNNEINSNNCRISKLMGDISDLEFVYDQNKMSQIKWDTGTIHTYNFINITNDSIILRRDGQTDYFPLISMKYNGSKLIQLNYYYNTGNHNIYKFEYSSNKIRVTLDYDNSQLNNLYYGDYFFDANGNIENLKVYKYEWMNGNYLPELWSDIEYTYDTYNNPMKDIKFQTFFYQTLPDPRFFSNNNYLTTNTSNTYFNEYNYVYNSSGYTIECLERQENYAYSCDE